MEDLYQKIKNIFFEEKDKKKLLEEYCKKGELKNLTDIISEIQNTITSIEYKNYLNLSFKYQQLDIYEYLLKLKLYSLNDNFDEVKKLCIEKEHTSLYSYLYTNTHFSKKDDDEIQKNFIYSIKNNKMKNIQYFFKYHSIDSRPDNIDEYFFILKNTPEIKKLLIENFEKNKIFIDYPYRFIY